ncbi:hypothetical protein GALMADRAFT_131069 [Galerina marginata CBS 339.88]|uniref:NAD(P)-binding protein n=1 Tax=Galerina marginata (strain CBS 339.88) TaxID=685588 RepID=A0A067S5W3_GALM3|nr:hypothetical protein GALMADRAFT_131069 [Galerina marginata CBS 339.88]
MPGIALVTGASQGIGRAIACRLAKDGFQVALNDLPSRQSQLEGVRAEIEEIGSQAFLFFADVSAESQVEQMINDVVQKMGGLDVLVANAGICITKPFLETTREDLAKLLSVNVEGVFFCYKHAALQMIKQGRGGRIIGASSIAGKQAWPLLGAYSTTKFAVRGMTQGAALELGKHNITVNAYAPGAVDTDMLHHIRQETAQNAAKAGTQAPPRRPPLGRESTPEEIAGLVSYLVSKDAAMITGQCVSINGGMFFD